MSWIELPAAIVASLFCLIEVFMDPSFLDPWDTALTARPTWVEMVALLMILGLAWFVLLSGSGGESAERWACIGIAALTGNWTRGREPLAERAARLWRKMKE